MEDVPLVRQSARLPDNFAPQKNERGRRHSESRTMDFHGRITHAADAAKEAQDSSHARELEMLVGIEELVMSLVDINSCTCFKL